eukprot:1193007-Prorocentrum_minimum.AAC.4
MALCLQMSEPTIMPGCTLREGFVGPHFLEQAVEFADITRYGDNGRLGTTYGGTKSGSMSGSVTSTLWQGQLRTLALRAIG